MGWTAILLFAQATSNAPLFEIPRKFWGEYNENLAHCGTGLNDSRLRISWDRIRFYETTGEVQELLRQSDGSIVIVAKHYGEGQTWNSTYQLRLSDDLKVLTVIHPQNETTNQFSSNRYRCPAS